ncbi:MAG TPA: hypothetical protein DCY13_09180 [Verrucomicrobiales bacterium]|nr:hypothetical protein [Verrucomicrobiales bacterium]
MQDVSIWFSELPTAWWHVKAPPPVCVAAYYTGLLLVVSGTLRRTPKWAVPALVVLPLVAALDWRREHHRTQLTVLPLKGGHAVCLELAGGETWLIDPGNEGSYDFRVRPFLQSRGINRLDHLVLTHGDLRHIGGAARLIADFAPRRVHAGPLLHRSTAYRQLLASLEDSGQPAGIVANGTVLPPWTVVHPDAGDRFQRADTGPLVLAGELAGRRILLAPDLDREGQLLLAERHSELRADLLITSPGTDGDPARAELLQLLRPDWLIVADATHPATERVRPVIRQRLRDRVKEVSFTSDTGTLQIREDREGFAVWRAADEPRSVPGDPAQSQQGRFVDGTSPVPR